MPVHNEHLPEAVVGETSCNVEHVLDERRPADRERSREINVMGTVADADAGKEHELVRRTLGRALADRRHDHDVGVDREMRPMIFDRRHRDQGAFPGAHRVVHLFPREMLVQIWNLCHVRLLLCS